MAKIRKHMCVSVKGALRNKAFKIWTYEDGTPVPAKKAKAMLLVADFEGKRVIPMNGEPCEGFSYETGCPGHPIPDEEPESIKP